jgi:holliday junction DNA helicase RuvA
VLIGFLRGRLIAKHPPQMLVDVGGVGYEIDAPMSTFYGLGAVGEEISLHTHLVVREDAHVLYGFGSERERRIFRELIRISGVGPKLALALLSGISVERLLVCIESEDADALVRIPGVGRKTAERLLVELRDRVRIFGVAGATSAQSGQGPASARAAEAEAYSALVALGYRPAEVSRLLKSVDAPDASTEELIRQALKNAAQV